MGDNHAVCAWLCGVLIGALFTVNAWFGNAGSVVDVISSTRSITSACMYLLDGVSYITR